MDCIAQDRQRNRKPGDKVKQNLLKAAMNPKGVKLSLKTRRFSLRINTENSITCYLQATPKMRLQKS